MKEMLKWFGELVDVYGKDANFIVYYAGHGVPDEKGNCKLIPADVSINDVNNGYSLKEVYTSLGKLPLNSALVLIDAYFSGNLILSLHETAGHKRRGELWRTLRLCEEECHAQVGCGERQETDTMRNCFAKDAEYMEKYKF